MVILILLGIVVFIIVGIAQNKAKNAPFKAIDDNEMRAYVSKKKLVENLTRVIASNIKNLEEVEYRDKKEKEDAKEALKEKSELLNDGIQAFEDQYTQLKERFKFDVKSLLEVSIDYADWFYYYSSFYDPINGELWNDDSWQDMREDLLKIKEIEKRLKSKTE